MPMAPKFHLDENVRTAVAAELRKRDRDCSTTQEEELMGANDPQQLAFCIEQDRILVTNDADFHELLKETPDHPGIIFWLKKKHFGQLVKDIDNLCMTMTADEFRGRVFYL